MPRQLRVEFSGAVYHVMARGNRREDIVRDDTDRQKYEACWEEAVQKTGWEVLARVLMSNHYHAVIRTPEPNLVDGMRWLHMGSPSKLSYLISSAKHDKKASREIRHIMELSKKVKKV